MAWHAISVLVSLTSSIYVLRWLIENTLSASAFLLLLFALLLLVFVFAFPYAAVIVSLLTVLRGNTSRTRQLALIITSYITVALVFTGIYYSIALASDYNQSLDQFYGTPITPAFDGIRLRLFTLGTPALTSTELQERMAKPDPAYLWPNRLDFQGAYSFQPVAQASVLADCLYLSVTTMSLTGQGTVQPLSAEARLANSVELISAVLLLIVAVGMLFSGWWAGVRAPR